ncbi:hypothetical protein DQW50_00110 [Halorubrum sp. 48-1-W]|uniref:hypothetical protein n=1 Tax=Halorubrum sp. 48-1-W TaxID=2249761 RepID=UPI000DCC976A|nr:hypothetical protein [Halorubrum sp. 48-1-W]RAW46840.1 hypothetical protein DQW50_00110 [Halorubrum sp. 48-1-W]
MPSLDITDDHRERIEALRAELADRHAGPYATVGTEEVLSYLLDLAEVVEDPDRSADPDRLATGGAGSGADTEGSDDESSDDEGSDADGRSAPFDRERAREALRERNLKHGDPEEAERSDLYSIAAVFDVAGRSDMAKDELIEAILDAAVALAVDPFAHVDVTVPESVDEDDADDAESAGDDADDAESAGDDGDVADDGGAGQLNAMMSLLDTHDDKWWEGDGDVRYEVELPDGDVETARTKDDVRAILFRNY